MKKLLTICLFVLGGGLALQAQVAITQDGSQPDNSAMVDIKSTAKGLLMPRMSSSQRLAIVSPAVGLIVFDSDQKGFLFYNGTGWMPFSTGTNPWTVSAAGINPFSLQPTLYTDSAWVGIGTHTPQSALQISTPDFTFGLTHSNGTVRVGTFVGAGGGWVATNTNHPLYFGTGVLLNILDPQMMLGTNGTVGINTTTPNSSYKLDVNGGINSSANISAIGVVAKDSVKTSRFSGTQLTLSGTSQALNFQLPTGEWTINEVSSGNLEFSFTPAGQQSKILFIMTPGGGLLGPSNPNLNSQSVQSLSGNDQVTRTIQDQQAEIKSLTERLAALEQKISVIK